MTDMTKGAGVGAKSSPVLEVEEKRLVLIEGGAGKKGVPEGKRSIVATEKINDGWLAVVCKVKQINLHGPAVSPAQAIAMAAWKINPQKSWEAAGAIATPGSLVVLGGANHA